MLASGCASEGQSADGGADLSAPGSDGGGGGSDGGGSDGGGGGGDLSPGAGASVLQLHNHANRDGVYTDPAFTKARVANLQLDPAFDGTYAQAGGAAPAYAQPLFLDGHGAGDVVIVATEANPVIAFDAANGKVKWNTGPQVIGTAAGKALFGCGNVDPSGITGTPAIDLASRSIFFQADVDSGGKVKHMLWALSIDDGKPRPGWPIDVSTFLPNFADGNQGERGALLVLGGTVYVPFGGRAGDCTPYRGYVVGVPIADPAHPFFFATRASDAGGAGAGGGIWAPTGLSSDGTSIFFDTGNAQGTFPTDWNMSYTEGVFRLSPSLKFDNTDATSYFAPAGWHQLDVTDVDISGAGILLVDLPGTSTPRLAVALGKDAKVYLLDASNLGGINMTKDGLFSATVAGSEIINTPAWYTTQKGTYVAFKAVCPAGGAPTLNAIRIDAGPTASNVWCASNTQGGGSPMVTTSGAGGDTVVWFVSTEGENITPDYKLHGFDGDTGAPVVTSPAMGSSKRFITPIAAKGHIYVATDARLYSFIVP